MTTGKKALEDECTLVGAAAAIMPAAVRPVSFELAEPVDHRQEGVAAVRPRTRQSATIDLPPSIASAAQVTIEHSRAAQTAAR
jgi:hypothetical protein